MKENQGRWPWRPWAKYEAVDASGEVFQYEEKPILNSFMNWEKTSGKIDFVGSWNQPDDASKALIERYVDERSKQNTSRFPWNDGAKFETVDRAGRVYQWQNKPYPSQGSWWSNMEGLEWHVESIDPPKDYALTLIERYPSEQPAPTPFVFGLEHIGKRVRHRDGLVGVVAKIDYNEPEYFRLKISWDGKKDYWNYNLNGQSKYDGNFLVSLIEPPTAQPIQALMDRVAALEAQLKTQLDISQEFTQRIAILEDGIQTLLPNFYAPIASGSDDVSFDDLRFFVNEPDAQPDPTAQKVEALKLLFEWRDGCEFMTVNRISGTVGQWSIAPFSNGDVWGQDRGIYYQVGHISPDVELSKILIKRNDGE